jgi:hypothetical protein
MSRAEWSSTTGFIKHCVEILEAENPMTVRQLFYRLVSDHTIKNCDRDYGYVSRMMTKARQDRRVDYDWIVDRSRPEYMPNVWNDVGGYARAVSRSYRKDYWNLQPRYSIRDFANKMKGELNV